jgi:redox-sensitive bicupin YhaK (pirin superfamily)
MATLLRSQDRGHLDHGWLNTYHTFSFGQYFRPDRMGYRSLRVMNEDVVAPGQGFGTHPHHDMEIVTYVLSGALEHKDSMGNGEVLRPGEFQRMTAGTGITHSEFNPSATEPVHLYQIWLRPDRAGHSPSYEQKSFPADNRQNQFRLVASPDADQGSLQIHQDARIFLAELTPGGEVTPALAPGRHAWVQVLRGTIQLGSNTLGAGDAAAFPADESPVLKATEPAELMLFDLA